MKEESLPQTTFPAGVTRPNSLTFTWIQNKTEHHGYQANRSHTEQIQRKNNTSMIVPLVITPREVYIGPLGFFFTPMISRLKVHFSSGCVTWALVNRNPEGRMKRSYLGGFLVKPGPTNVHFVTILFHCFAAREENRKEINIKEPAARKLQIQNTVFLQLKWFTKKGIT